MAYEKQEWKTGDTITAEKMNHIEDGVANSTGGLFIIHATDYDSDENTWSKTDKTFDEIYAAAMAGLDPVIYCVDYGIEKVYRLMEAYNTRLRFIYVFNYNGTTNSVVATLFKSNPTSTWEFN